MTLLLFLLDWEKAIHGWRQLESKNLVLKGTVYILERPLLTISKFSHKNVLQKCFCLLSMIILHLLSVGRPQFSIMSQRNLRSVEANLNIVNDCSTSVARLCLFWQILELIGQILIEKLLNRYLAQRQHTKIILALKLPRFSIH